MQVGEYGAMVKANAKSGLSVDHIPSFAAVKKYTEQTLGVRLNFEQEAALRKSTLTLVYERKYIKQHRGHL